MLAMVIWIGILGTGISLILIVACLRRWSIQMEETPYWWVLQSIEQKWNALASVGMVLLILALIGVKILRGMYV